jgi:hypothetical protein
MFSLLFNSLLKTYHWWHYRRVIVWFSSMSLIMRFRVNSTKDLVMSWVIVYCLCF